MPTRTERRKQLRQHSISKSDLKNWEAEFVKLPPIIQKIFISLQNKVEVLMDVFIEAKHEYPHYWNEKHEFEPIKIKKMKWNY